MKVRFLERLEEAGLIKRNRVNADSVRTMPFSQLIDLADAVTADTRLVREGFRSSAHTHCASFDMAGGIDECGSIDCREKAANELARFAALYSDQVIIHSYLSRYAPSWGHPPEKDSPDFRINVIDDIRLLLLLRPLIEAGKIVVISPEAEICPYCYALKLFGSRADQRLRKAMKRLSKDLSQMSMEVYKAESGCYDLLYHTPHDLFRHEGHVRSYDKLPKPIASMPALVKQIKKGESVAVSGELKRKLGINAEVAEDVLGSLRYQMSVADLVGASFLTGRDVDIQVLSYISSDVEIDHRNEIAAKYLKAIVPFAADVPISSLLRLRHREEEAFIQFRSALDAALKEMVGQRGVFTERDAQSLYSDVIAPEIARLDRRVKEAKRDLIKAPFASAAGAAGVIAFGIYSGMVPAEVKLIASALGLTKVIYDIASKGAEMADVNKSVRPEKFYFLWKVRNLARRRRTSHIEY
jgi:hypothetical protein